MRRIRLAIVVAALAGVLAGPSAFAGAKMVDSNGGVGQNEAAVAYVAEAASFKDLSDGRTRIYNVDAILYRHAGETRAFARAFVALCPVTSGVCPVVRGSARLTRIPTSDLAVDPILRRATLRTHLGSRLVWGLWREQPAFSGPCGADPICKAAETTTRTGGGPFLCPPGLLVGAFIDRTAYARVGMFGRTFSLDGSKYNQIASLDAVALAEVNGSYDESTGYCR